MDQRISYGSTCRSWKLFAPLSSLSQFMIPYSHGKMARYVTKGYTKMTKMIVNGKLFKKGSVFHIITLMNSIFRRKHQNTRNSQWTSGKMQLPLMWKVSHICFTGVSSISYQIIATTGKYLSFSAAYHIHPTYGTSFINNCIKISPHSCSKAALKT